jgi:hypothetical protein
MIRKILSSHHSFLVYGIANVNLDVFRSFGYLKYPVNGTCRLRTTLCLQYKPDYIAASSIFLAATALEKMELLTKKKKFWWLEFEVSPKQLKG